MLDLHTHSLLSDGGLLPSELARRLDVLGYRFLAITDHVGPENLERVVREIGLAAQELNRHLGLTLIPGVELTHVPPALISPLARRARELGAAWVVVHGETVVEPVAAGTNQAALEADPPVDLLAHPGLLTPEQAALAARRGVALELTAKKGHSLTNGLVARLGLEAGADLLVNSDGHQPGDYLTDQLARQVALGAGLSPNQADGLRRRALELAARAAARR